MLANVFYTLGVWIDKFLFWFNPDTSVATFGPLRSSSIYDIPMFIAFLTMIPAIAVFILHMESKFALIYPRFMETIFKRKTLADIEVVSHQLVMAGREAMMQLFKTQAFVLVVMFLSSSFIFERYHLVPMDWNLLCVLLVGAALNATLWALLNLLYYMTHYRHAVYVSALFCVSNGVLTGLSLYAGPWYFGYGFSLSFLAPIALALYYLNKNFNDLAYSTFMLVD